MPAVKNSLAAEEDDWRADSDLRALIEAEKIRNDPKRMKAAMKKRKELTDALRNVKG